MAAMWSAYDHGGDGAMHVEQLQKLHTEVFPHPVTHAL
jgi:hypothetical protein